MIANYRSLGVPQQRPSTAKNNNLIKNKNRTELSLGTRCALSMSWNLCGCRGEGEAGGILQDTFLYPTEVGVNEAEIHPAHKNPMRALISNMD